MLWSVWICHWWHIGILNIVTNSCHPASLSDPTTSLEDTGQQPVHIHTIPYLNKAFLSNTVRHCMRGEPSVMCFWKILNFLLKNWMTREVHKHSESLAFLKNSTCRYWQNTCILSYGSHQAKNVFLCMRKMHRFRFIPTPSMCKDSSGHLLSIDIFYSVLWFY